MTVTLSPEAVEWLASGERGLSSRAIFDWLLFRKVDPKWGAAYPVDPDDFRRCELLLREVPELRPRLSEMADLRPEWAGLVEHWDEIADAMEQEAPLVFEHGARLSVGCPRAYRLMCDIERKAAA